MGGASALIRPVVFGTAIAGAALLFGAVSVWSRVVILILCIATVAVRPASRCALPRGVDRSILIPMFLLLAFVSVRSFVGGIVRYAPLDSLSVAMLAVCVFLASTRISRGVCVVARAACSVVWFALVLLIVGGLESVDWWFHNRNILAMYTMMTALLFMGFFEGTDGTPDGYAWIVVAAAIIVMSMLRGYAALASFAAVAAFALLRRFTRMSSVVAGVVFLAGVLLLSVTHPESFLDRAVWTLTAVRIWLRNLLVGVGPGMFGFFYPEFSAGLPATETATTLSHNLYAGLAAETGVWGLLLCAVMAYAFWENVSWNRRESTAAGYAMAGALLCSLADFSLLMPMNVVLFAALAGSALSNGARGPTSPQSGDDARNSDTVVVCATLAVLCVVTATGAGGSSSWAHLRREAVDRVYAGDRTAALALLRTVSRYNPRDAETYAVAATLLPSPDRFAMLRTAILLNPRAARRYARMVRESP